jgi:tetratricopeptide (TPR) repeat protein
VKQRGGPSAAVIGGTIPYMAPEQLAAFRGSHIPIDHRADIFALGIILYELLTRRSPFPLPASPPAMASDAEIDAFIDNVLHSRQAAPAPARLHNRSVTPAVDSILRRALEADPTRRYQSARQLQEDLQRQLDSEPLKHAPDPSLRERLRKRIRHSPRLVVRAVLALALVVVAAAMVGGYLNRLKLKVQTAERETSDLKAFHAAERAERFAREKQEKAAVAARLTRTGEVNEAAAEMSREIRQAQFLLNIDDGPLRRAQGVTQARNIRDRFDRLAAESWEGKPVLSLLGSADHRRLKDDLAELFMSLARAVATSEALPLLTKAEELFDEVPPPLWSQQAILLDQEGRKDEARKLRERIQSHPLRRARDHYLAARELLSARRFRQALLLLEKAVSLEPGSVMGNLYLGVCQDQLKKHREAVGCYSVCLAVAPDFHAGYFNRGLAYAHLREYPKAVADLDRAIELRPGLPQCYLNRGLARYEWGKLIPNNPQLMKDAVADFTRVLELDPQQTRVYILRARARTFLGDKAGAEADEREALQRDAGNDDRSWNARGHAHLERKQIDRALDCFERGLQANPGSLDNLTSKEYLLSEFLGRPREALEIADRVVRDFPDYTWGRSSRGILLARLGRHDEARQDAAAALQRSNEPEMLYRVGSIYAQTSVQYRQDADRALELLHSALRRGFGFAELPADPDLRPLHSLARFTALREWAQGPRGLLPR